MKKLIVFLVVVAILLSSCLYEKCFAVGDPLTMSALAASAYGIANTFGMSFTSAGMTAAGAQSLMEGEITNYCNGRTIAEAFGEEAIKAIGGKIVVAHTTYNSIVSFLNWMNTKYNLGVNRVGLGFMFADDYGYLNDDGGAYLNGWDLVNVTSNSYWMRKWYGPDGKTATTGNNDVLKYQYPNVDGPLYFVQSSGILGRYIYSDDLGATKVRNDTLSWAKIYPEESERPKRAYATSDGSIGSAVVLNPDKAWSGYANPWEGPDTNLDQLTGDIFNGVADVNLDVEGEVIDVDPPSPPPTPAPIDPDLPLSDVPWEGLDNNLQQLYEQGLEEIGTIGEAKDAITEAVGDQTEALEGAIADNAGVVSGAIDQAVSDVGSAIGTQTGAISAAIDQAVSDVQTAIGEQTAALDESLSATAEGVETIAEAIEDEQINWQKFDLKGLFPFCIPFDIYNMLKALDASPTAPHVQIPFVIQSIGFSYTLDLDFSAFDPVAAIMRQMEIICYGLALAWATSKVIKW